MRQERLEIRLRKMWCGNCGRKIVFEPDVYGTETDGSINALFEGDDRGDWVTLGFIDCYGDYGKCASEIVDKGFAEEVLNHVINELRQFESYGVKTILANRELFPHSGDYLADKWLYLIKDGVKLRCHLFASAIPSDARRSSDMVSFETSLVCQ